MVNVPDGRRPIWGIPVLDFNRERFALKSIGSHFVGHNPTISQRLPRATWLDINWSGHGHWWKMIPVSYLGLLASMQTQGKEWYELYENWKDLTPSGLIDWFRLTRKSCPVSIEREGTVVYTLSGGERQLRWKDDGRARHWHEGSFGKLEAVLTSKDEPLGSHELLMRLVEDLGFPEEMLEPIPT